MSAAVAADKKEITPLLWKPKPPVISESHPHQRYFCPPGAEGSLTGVVVVIEGSTTMEVDFYRHISQDRARLSVSIRGVAHVGAMLSPDQLRQVARLCLDCAYDLETVPATGAGQ